MMKSYIANAFSLNMIVDALSHGDPSLEININRVDEIVAVEFMDAEPESVVGHADIAEVMSNILERKVRMNRTTVRLERGDVMLVAQYTGPRLPEGATSLPKDAKITWLLLEVI